MIQDFVCGEKSGLDKTFVLLIFYRSVATFFWLTDLHKKERKPKERVSWDGTARLVRGWAEQQHLVSWRHAASWGRGWAEQQYLISWGHAELLKCCFLMRVSLDLVRVESRIA